jgi:hypothetical protein
MRRKAARIGAERLILSLYWFFSGYEMRAWRALVPFIAVVALLPSCFTLMVSGIRTTPSPMPMPSDPLEPRRTRQLMVHRLLDK